ncbi:MAG: hypothetical protein NW205_11610 [Hyphomicrobiaceae bacterium]|nr:hypothetical protein [Hyphomicrobiaceae bacterium]
MLYALLPEDGNYVALEAAQIALAERTGEEASIDQLGQCIFALVGQAKIDWLPDEKQLRRTLPNHNRSPPWPISCERDLEPWLERYLWQSARGFYSPPPPSLTVVVENTARVPVGTQWTRPDLSMACVTRYLYQPVPVFDLFTFELKLAYDCNVRAVHESLAHSSSANFSYLAVYAPEGDEASVQAETNLPIMLEQAGRHGVGIIQIRDPRRPRDGYRRLLDARRHAPSPAKIDGFIEDRFHSVNKLALRRWVKP